MPTMSPRHVAGALLTAFIAMFAVLAVASPSQADDGYRYWNYSHLKGSAFEFAQTGPGDFTPKDGAVEGWRFGTSTTSVGIEPRADLATVSFDTVCGDEKAAAGKKRVAVLVDYGTKSDAESGTPPKPQAECAVVPTAANGQQTLESVTKVRGEKGMICALDGYPVKGCGEPVGDAKVAANEATVSFALPSSDDSSSTDANQEDSAEDGGGISWPLVAVIALVVILAAGAVPLYRRNRES